MRIDFYKTDELYDAVTAKVFCVYFIDADRTYKGIKGVFKGRKGHAAVRTIRGCGVMNILDKNNILLPAESLFIVPAWKLISYHPKDDQWVFRWFEFEATKCIIEEERVHILNVSRDEIILMDNTFETIRKGSKADLEAASSYFSSTMYLWKGKIDYGKTSNNIDKISEITERIRRNPQINYSVETLAKQCALSVRGFRDVFTRKMNMSPKKFILKTRMEKANELLLLTSMPISVVAESVGFKDEFYFSRAFKKYFGTAPSHIRNL